MCSCFLISKHTNFLTSSPCIPLSLKTKNDVFLCLLFSACVDFLIAFVMLSVGNWDSEKLWVWEWIQISFRPYSDYLSRSTGNKRIVVGPSDRPRRGVLSPAVVHVHTQHISCMCLKVSCLHNEPVIVC